MERAMTTPELILTLLTAICATHAGVWLYDRWRAR